MDNNEAFVLRVENDYSNLVIKPFSAYTAEFRRHVKKHHIMEQLQKAPSRYVISTFYNGYQHYISLSKERLVCLGNEIKEKWIKDLKDEIAIIEAINFEKE